MSEEWGVPAVLSDEAQSVEGEGGDGEAEAGPGQDVSGVVLVVRHPGDGDQDRVDQHQHLTIQRLLSFALLFLLMNVLREWQIVK